MADGNGVEVVSRPLPIGESSLTQGVKSHDALSSEAISALQNNVTYLCDQICNGDIPEEHTGIVAEELLTLAEELLAQPGDVRLSAYHPLALAYVTLDMSPAAVIAEGLRELGLAIEAQVSGASKAED